MLCQNCEIDKPENDFPVRKDRSGRKRPYCKDCVLEGQRARYNHHRKTAPFKHRCSRAKTRAKRLGVPFDLTPEYLESLWTGTCPVLGETIHLVSDRKDEMAAELDRFVPSLGYVKGNVHFLSRRTNRLKNNTNTKELRKLLEWMERIDES
jgi:hypothetical protein